jgi:uncharacterized protein (DUF3820 family)
MKMTFGKYKGEELEDLPTYYLQWIAENLDTRAALVKEAEEQLTLREERGVARRNINE